MYIYVYIYIIYKIKRHFQEFWQTRNIIVVSKLKNNKNKYNLLFFSVQILLFTKYLSAH